MICMGYSFTLVALPGIWQLTHGSRVSSRLASNCAAWRTAGLGPWHQQSCRGFLLRKKKKHLEVSWNRWFKMDIPIKMDDLGVSYFRNHIKYQHLLATWSTNLRVAGRCRSLVSELEHWLHWLQTDTIRSLRHRSHSKLDKTHIIPVGSWLVPRDSRHFQTCPGDVKQWPSS